MNIPLHVQDIHASNTTLDSQKSSLYNAFVILSHV